MIDSKKPCVACNRRDEQGHMMHRVDNINEGVIRGYWCPSCNNWETLDITLNLSEFKSGRIA